MPADWTTIGQRHPEPPKPWQWGAAFMTIAAMVLTACNPEISRISRRNPDLFEKETDHFVGISRGQTSHAAPDLYVKRPGLKISERRPNGDDGSLFNPDDERNFLFTHSGPLTVGKFVKVRVVPNHLMDDKATAASGSEGGKGGGKGKGDNAKPDEVEAELLKALPEMAPAGKEHPAFVAAFKMKITQRFPNGDVLANFTRKSVVGEQERELVAEARVPYDRLTSGDDLTTDDLVDVHFREVRGNDLADRSSPSWEDDYSLRLSGFSEAKSKVAQDLQDQKQHLADAAAKLETKIKSFGEDRRQLVKQRDDLNKKKSEAETKSAELGVKLKEQADLIDKQQDEIKRLEPDEDEAKGKGGGGGTSKG